MKHAWNPLLHVGLLFVISFMLPKAIYDWLSWAVENFPAYILGAIFILGLPIGLAFTIIGAIIGFFRKRS
jgi:hypothetical protein